MQTSRDAVMSRLLIRRHAQQEQMGGDCHHQEGLFGAQPRAAPIRGSPPMAQLCGCTAWGQLPEEATIGRFAGSPWLCYLEFVVCKETARRDDKPSVYSSASTCLSGVFIEIEPFSQWMISTLPQSGRFLWSTISMKYNGHPSFVPDDLMHVGSVQWGSKGKVIKRGSSGEQAEGNSVWQTLPFSV